MLNPMYSPYGAYEMKARYQHNFMMGMAFVTSLVMFILLTFWVIAKLSPEVIVINKPLPTKVYTIKEIPPAPRIKVKYELQEIKQVDKSKIKVGIPTAVADSLIDEEFLLPTQDDLARVVDAANLNPGNFDGAIFEFEEDAFPEPTDFVYHEKVPVFVYRHKPDYPRLAEMAGITGIVTVQVLVDINGDVIDARIGKSSGTTSLDEAALRAASKNKFTPATQNGRPVAVWVTYKVEFEKE